MSRPAWSPDLRARVRTFTWGAGLLMCLYSVLILRVCKLALGSEVHSYILLVPFISAYLVWINRGSLRVAEGRDRVLASIFGVAGFIATAGYLSSVFAGYPMHGLDALSLGSIGLVCMLVAWAAWSFGRSVMRAQWFPIAFLGFLVPLPTFAVDAIETFLQHASAEAASVGSSRVDLQACKLEYSIVSPK